MSEPTVEKKIDELNFAVEKSMRYHQRIRGHYDYRHKAIMFLTIIFGSAAFSEVVEWSRYFGALVAVLAAVDLVFSLSHRARDHEILFRQFSDLASVLRTSSKTQENYDTWLKARLAIEANELPVYWALEADCDNEVRRAWDRTGMMAKIDWWKRRTMYWIHYDKEHFPLTTSS